MSTIQPLFDEYSASHQDKTNKMIHWICVPAIMISLMGLLWSIPTPSIFQQFHIGSVTFNWAMVFIIFALFYYVRLSIPLAIGMLFVVSVFLYINFLLSKSALLPLWAISLIIFAVAWVGQFWGHKIEGKKPSFLKDLQFLLIGPVWLLHFVYRKVGIGY